MIGSVPSSVVIWYGSNLPRPVSTTFVWSSCVEGVYFSVVGLVGAFHAYEFLV